MHAFLNANENARSTLDAISTRKIKRSEPKVETDQIRYSISHISLPPYRRRTGNIPHMGSSPAEKCRVATKEEKEIKHGIR